MNLFVIAGLVSDDAVVADIFDAVGNAVPEARYSIKVTKADGTVDNMHVVVQSPDAVAWAEMNAKANTPVVIVGERRNDVAQDGTRRNVVYIGYNGRQLISAADGLNVAVLYGRLVDEPRMRQYQNQGGKQITAADFRLAVNRNTANRTADFFNIAAYGRTAEFVGRYFHKGMACQVKGPVFCNSYTDPRNGRLCVSDILRVQVVEFGESRKTNTTT